MKHRIFALVAVAMVAVAGVNVYKVSASEVEMSDLQKENVEALAGGEGGTVHSGAFFSFDFGKCIGADSNCVEGLDYPGYSKK